MNLLEASAEDLYENAPCGYLSTLPDGRIVKVNQTFLRWTGHDRDDLLGRRFQDLLTAGGRIYHETHYAPLLRMQGAVREIALDVVCADGRRLPALVNSVLLADDAGRPQVVRTTIFNATDRKRYEQELLHARNEERAARERVERLQRITAALTAALVPAEVAAAVVDELAQRPGVALAVLLAADEQGDLRELRRAGPALELGAEVTAAVDAREPRFVDRRDGLPALAVLPLRFDQRLVGVLCVGLEGEEAVPEPERVFVTACASQCAQALENARLYEQERNVALVLQRSMLPASLPRDPRFEVAAHYQPGYAGLEIGGDFYDVFSVADDIVAVVVGDVVGRGLEAAAAMGQLRSAVRALALTRLGPAAVLERLDVFADQVPATQSATVAYAEIALGSGEMRFACAGHPPPVVAQPRDAPALAWDGRSAPLGLFFADVTRPEAAVALEPGARVLLYTDGLVERRRRAIDIGLDALVEEVGRRRATPLAAAIDELVRTLLDADAGADDVCLLGVDYRG